MVKTLQKKFILTAMIAVTIVMVIFFAAINILNLFSVNRDAEKTLQLIMAEKIQSVSDAEGPKGSGPGSGKEPDSKPNDQDSNPEKPEERSDPPPEKPGVSSSLEPKRPETEAIRESLSSEQYFTIKIDENNEIVDSDFSSIAQMTEEDAYSLLEDALEKNSKSGIVDGYRFLRIDAPSKGSHFLFLDSRQQQKALFRTFIVTVAVSAATWLFTLLLVIVLSRRAINPIAENIERQKQFVTDAGHEIKTPLAIIQSNADVLELQLGSNKWIDNIHSQIARLSSLTQELLMLSRMEEGAAAGLLTETFDAGSGLVEALAPFREGAQIRGIQIHENVPGGVLAVCPREAYLRLLSLLFENALKYTRDGGYIDITLTQANKKVQIIQKNDTATELTGDPERLFDRFYRSDKARTQNKGGSGIGLSVARALAEQIGGSIHAEYTGNYEITFTVRIPGPKR